ncbi:Dna replication complex gins sld5 [Quillaja saponaria]|uniref:Dna replication complex gins sld5 n=1 Tax=Quillaja saponaria TaxID=32244 RepID=A0AAD7PD91_QUISA|nr:Dna replication complex gins sld5 [Quillaja saponaria]
MDKTEPGKEAPEEVSRESLIALSYSEPEKVLTGRRSSEKLNSENLVQSVGCDDEKYRSELISIYFSHCPETEDLPVALGEQKG